MTTVRTYTGTLATPLADAIPRLDRAPGEPQRVRMVVKDGPNLFFRGALVDSYASNSKRPRYEELELWAVDGGGYVAAHHWRSNIEGEETFTMAAQVETVEDAMAVWQWTPVAKGFAKALKWDAAIRLGGGE